MYIILLIGLIFYFWNLHTNNMLNLVDIIGACLLGFFIIVLEWVSWLALIKLAMDMVIKTL